MQRQIDHSLQQILNLAPKTETGAIDLTKADLIAEGGTHLLYRFPDAPFVIKLMKQNPTPQELDELEKKYAVLYDCFDKDKKQRCIREQHLTYQVLLPGKEPQQAALSFVPYEKCFNAKIKFDFKIEPAELDPYLVEHYQELFVSANRTFINKDNFEGIFNLDEYKIIDERIGGILTRLDSDSQLRDIMIEFLTHYRDFYQKTNIILDAMGFENILFFKDEAGDWQFKVGSAIKHDTGKFTNELFDRMHTGNEVNLKEFVNFTHAYFSPANIRAVNVCAMKLGLKPVVDDVAIDPAELLKISQALSVPERMLAYAQHNDFEKMEKILQENKHHLCFDLGNFWAYPRIADEYIKHGKSLQSLKIYLDIVSEFPVILPVIEDDAKRIEGSKRNITYRKNKIILHQDLTSPLPLWQTNLINSIYNTVKNNYIFSEDIDEIKFKANLSDHFAKLNSEVKFRNLNTLPTIAPGFSKILLLPDGASLPLSIPNDSIIVKLVANQIATYKMVNDKLAQDKSKNVSQDEIAEISSHFPRSGNLNKEITLVKNPELFKKIISICDYDRSPIKKKFVEEVNKILKIIDPHLILQHDPVQIADHKQNKRIVDDPRGNNCARFKLADLDPPASWFEHFKKQNYGFVEEPPIPIPGTVGYVKINDFLDPRDSLGRLAQQKAYDILKNMQGREAIIVDLRDSHGGSPEMVEFLLSHFLSDTDQSKIKGGVYNRVFDSSTGSTKDYKVKPTEFNLNVPVYILTNNQTFSAAEEFAYDLQQLNKHALKDNRFTVMGQTTKGGAHPMTGFPLMDVDTREINHDYFLWTPDRKSENVYTHTNWEDGPKVEGKKPGVQPDFEILENQDALQVAIESIQRRNELLSSVSHRSSTAFMISLPNFEPIIPATSTQSYSLNKQKNDSASENTPQLNNVSSSIEEKSDQSATASTKSPFKNLSGTPRFTKDE